MSSHTSLTEWEVRNMLELGVAPGGRRPLSPDWRLVEEWRKRDCPVHDPRPRSALQREHSAPKIQTQRLPRHSDLAHRAPATAERTRLIPADQQPVATRATAGVGIPASHESSRSKAGCQFPGRGSRGSCRGPQRRSSPSATMLGPNARPPIGGTTDGM